LSIIVQICDNNRTFCYRPSFVACSGNYNWWAVQYGRFLLRNAMLSAVYAVVVCLSVCVCVSVTLRYCIKTAKRRITQITPHDSPLTLVVWCLSSLRNSNAITSYGGRQMQVGWV